MIKYKPNCATCQLSKADEKFRKRVRYAAFKRTLGDETLGDLALEAHISLGSVYNHVKKHLFDDTEANKKRRDTLAVTAVAKVKAKVQKDLELELDADTVDEIDSDPLQIMGLKDYIAQGNTMIKQGKLNITAQSYLVAVRTLNEYESKKTNNKIEFLRTISSFRSGANKANKKPLEGEIVNADGSTTKPTDSTGQGEDEPRSLHRRAFGNAPTSGTNYLS